MAYYATILKLIEHVMSGEEYYDGQDLISSSVAKALVLPTLLTPLFIISTPSEFPSLKVVDFSPDVISSYQSPSITSPALVEEKNDFSSLAKV